MNEDQLVETVFSSSLNGKHAGLGEDKAMLQRLTLFEQNTIISTILRILSNKASQSSGNSSIVGAIVVLLAELGRGEQTVCNILIDWLVKSATGAAGVSHVVHRAVIIMLSTKQGTFQSTSPRECKLTEEESLKQVLDKLLSQFGDKLYIQHAPIMNQEGKYSKHCTSDLHLT